MVIQVDGVNTLNKGAELMLWSIIEEIEKTNDDSIIIYNDNSFTVDNKPGLYFDSKGKVVKPWFCNSLITPVIKFFKIPLLYYKLKKHLITWIPNKNVDILLDASGYYFTDNWPFPDGVVQAYDYYLSTLKDSGCKIVFLPQAFGPCKKQGTQKMLRIVNKYADLIIAREHVSYDYLVDLGLDKDRICVFPDFTNTTKGVIPNDLKYLKDRICLIPNNQMIAQKSTTREAYITLLSAIIKKCQDNNKKAFLLCHDRSDKHICKELSDLFDIPFIENLNAVETKGVISQSYLVVSSRFHGVASALSSGIPCLATSWSHKYSLLFDEYNMTESILSIEDLEVSIEKVERLFDNNFNQEEREKLRQQGLIVNGKTREMWNKIWNI